MITGSAFERPRALLPDAEWLAPGIELNGDLACAFILRACLGVNDPDLIPPEPEALTLTVSATTLKTATKARADCLHKPPPPPPPPVPAPKRGKVPPALKLRAWSGTITYVHTDSFEGDCLIGNGTPAKVALTTREEHTWTITGPPQNDTDLKLGLHPVEWRVADTGNVTCDTRRGPGWGWLATYVGTGTGHQQGSLYFQRPPDALTTLILSSAGPPAQLPNAWHVDKTVDDGLFINHYTSDTYINEWFKELEIAMASTSTRRIQRTKTQPADPHQLIYFGMDNPSLIEATNTWSWDLTWLPAKVKSSP